MDAITFNSNSPSTAKLKDTRISDGWTDIFTGGNKKKAPIQNSEPACPRERYKWTPQAIKEHIQNDADYNFTRNEAKRYTPKNKISLEDRNTLVGLLNQQKVYRETVAIALSQKNYTKAEDYLNREICIAEKLTDMLFGLKQKYGF